MYLNSFSDSNSIRNETELIIGYRKHRKENISFAISTKDLHNELTKVAEAGETGPETFMHCYMFHKQECSPIASGISFSKHHPT